MITAILRAAQSPENRANVIQRLRDFDAVMVVIDPGLRPSDGKALLSDRKGFLSATQARQLDAQVVQGLRKMRPIAAGVDRSLLVADGNGLLGDRQGSL